MNVKRLGPRGDRSVSDDRKIGVLFGVLLAYLLLFALIAWAPASWLRPVLGFALACLATGSALLVLLWPRHLDLDLAEWLALAGCLSLALGGMAAYFMARSPGGLQLKPVLAVAWLFSTGVFMWARFRSHGANQQESPSFAGLRWRLQAWWTGQSPASRAVTLLLVVLLVSGAVQLHAVASRPTRHPPMAEFYLLGADYMAQDYPHTVVAGDAVSVAYGIANHSQEEAVYQVAAWLGEKPLATRAPVRLEPGQEYQATVTVALPEDARGLVRMDFALMQQGTLLRKLWLWLDIAAQAPLAEDDMAASAATGKPIAEER